MAGIARMGDNCSGHTLWPARPSLSGSSNVYVNGLPAHRQGDSWAPHSGNDVHSSATKTGSSNVIINGKGVARTNDSLDCDTAGTITGGSSNVVANEL